MANRNLEDIFHVIHNIRRELESFLNQTDFDGSESEIRKVDILRRYIDSFLPQFQEGLYERKSLLDEEFVFDFVYRKVKSIEGQIRSAVRSDRTYNEKVDELLRYSYKTQDLLNDVQLISIIDFNYRKRIDGLQERLLEENANKINAEIDIARDRLNEIIEKNQVRNQSEINSLRERLKTIFENNDKSFGSLIRGYDKELQEIKSKQFEENRIKYKAFEEFMNEVVLDRDGMIDKFEKYFSKIQSDWKKIQQIKTENVYLNSYHKNTARSKNSESKFIGVTVFSLMLSLITIIAFIFKAIDFSQFISIKIMIVVFFGILIAYYLKISTHYRRLADQAEQTHLELLAFPQYAAELGEEKSNEIKEQLALKYFGKEIDPSGYQKIGDIAQEQLKTSSELVKAAASLSVASTKTTENSTSTKPRNSTSQSETSGG
ncbi:hypothetical protein F946_03140 [Acinetobacter johnsonii ANC 3681]|uniref:Uncharacterized protein n=1 Tax=Acinetobacter johnsonii ANC 3681 TaxID=1217662 RepID=N9BDX6_ACIJO|nr:hypothetical protein [Acinetobacter johnsonii]ENV71461.1 hypothetical protein F946_03140 [Acinetobacter johnsonii ANC 3681]